MQHIFKEFKSCFIWIVLLIMQNLYLLDFKINVIKCIICIHLCILQKMLFNCIVN